MLAPIGGGSRRDKPLYQERPPAPHRACRELRWAREGKRDPFLNRKRGTPKHTDPTSGRLKGLTDEQRRRIQSL